MGCGGRDAWTIQAITSSACSLRGYLLDENISLRSEGKRDKFTAMP
jgi:hypothetical protein